MRPSPAAVLSLALLLCSHTQPVACGRKPRPAGSGGKTGDGLEASDSVANQTEVAAPAAKRPFTGVWLQRHFVNTTYYDQALCNDNSPPVFYYSAATSPHGDSQWLIWLQGGGWCWSTESCADRVSSVPQFTSTLSSPRQMHMGGVFDTDPKRNPFAEVNKVLVGYCSSDAWAGDTDNLVGENWMRFRGQRILSAVVHTLQASFGMDAARSVVMGGCHEGGRGAMYNTQNMAALMPVGSDFRVVIDSGFELDTAPFDAAGNPLELAQDIQNQTAAAYQFLNATGVVGDTPCGATYDLSTPWKCLFPPYRLPLLGGTPRFMSIMSQFDSWQLPRSVGTTPPYSANDTALVAYLTSFQRGVRSTALQLPTSGQSGSAIFSSACYSTCTTLSGAFWNVRVNNITAADYLASWWGGSGRPVDQLLVNTPQLIESCNGFGCGQCAKLSVAPAPPLPPARKGLQAPPTAGAGYPPVGFVAAKLGYTPGETYQQRQKVREQAREEKRETSRYSVTTVRVIHAAAALCVLLLCMLARPVFKAANKSSGGGRTGVAELTPLCQEAATNQEAGVAGRMRRSGGPNPSFGDVLIIHCGAHKTNTHTHTEP